MESPRVAYVLAYIDPVSGLIVLQVIAGGVLGAIAFFRRSIASFFAKITGRQPAEEPKKHSEEA